MQWRDVAILDAIEDLRYYLNWFAENRDLSDPDVVWVSRRLDRLLNEYTGLICMNDVSQELARLRKAKGLSPKELARLTGSTEEYIFNLENGKPGNVLILARVAAVLDVPLEQIYRK